MLLEDRKAYPLFKERMKAIFKDKSEVFFNSLRQEARNGFILNLIKDDAHNLLKECNFDYDIYPLNPNAFYYNQTQISHQTAYILGLIYPQEPSASLPALLPNIENKKVIIDLCAAPGGKIIGLLNRIEEDALIIANDINYKRALVLASNLERLGHDRVIVTSLSPAYLADKLKGQADLIILDAPCSGEGMIRKYPEILDNYSLKNILNCASTQKELLENAYDLLNDGGQILYSTCTYAGEEDEDNIIYFLNKHPDLKLIEINKQDYLKLSFLDGSEGQFMALMEKDGEAKRQYFKYEKSLKNTNYEILINQEIKLKNYYLYEDSGRLFMHFKERHQLAFKTIRHGIYVGDIKNKQFIFNHAFYRSNSLTGLYKNIYELNDSEFIKYLHGEEITADLANSNLLLTYHGYQFAYGKVNNGRIKNKYPKGLRLML